MDQTNNPVDPTQPAMQTPVEPVVMPDAASAVPPVTTGPTMTTEEVPSEPSAASFIPPAENPAATPDAAPAQAPAVEASGYTAPTAEEVAQMQQAEQAATAQTAPSAEAQVDPLATPAEAMPIATTAAEVPEEPVVEPEPVAPGATPTENVAVAAEEQKPTLISRLLGLVGI
jgi:hypothetical protein